MVVMLLGIDLSRRPLELLMMYRSLYPEARLMRPLRGGVEEHQSFSEHGGQRGVVLLWIVVSVLQLPDVIADDFLVSL